MHGAGAGGLFAVAEDPYGQVLPWRRSKDFVKQKLVDHYRKMEEMGLILPVREAHCDYLASAEYDDLLTLRSYIVEAKGATLKIATEIYRDTQLLVKGYVVLVCVDKNTRRVIRIPDYVKEKCKELMLEA